MLKEILGGIGKDGFAEAELRAACGKYFLGDREFIITMPLCLIAQR